MEPARLREPAAWIMLAVVSTSVLVGIFRLLLGGSGAAFGVRAALSLDLLVSPVSAALAVGAVVVCTRFGEPTPKSHLIGLGAAGALAIATLFGAISLLALLAGSLDFGDKVEGLVLTLPMLALTALALVFVLGAVAPTAPRTRTGRMPDQDQEPFFGGYQNDGYQGYGNQVPAPEPVMAPVVPEPAVPPASVPSPASAAPQPQHTAQSALPYAAERSADRTQDAYAAPVYDQGYAAQPGFVQPVEQSFSAASYAASQQNGYQQQPPQGPVFDQHGYAGDAPSYPPLSYDNPPVYDDTPAYPQHGGSPFVGYSGQQFAQQAYEPPYEPAYEPSYEGDPREQQLAQAYQQAQSYQQQPPQSVPQSVPQPAPQPLPPAPLPPAPPAQSGYHNPLGHPQTPPTPQYEGPDQTVRFQNDPYRGEPLTSPDLGRYLGDPMSGPESVRYQGDALSSPRYQGDPLSDPLRADQLIDPTAIYKPERPQVNPDAGSGREQAAQGAEATPHWYGSDRRDH
ncbi:hypothetical protein [Acrocarpospora catenulata]|uniref:hypothetical protein n=1 Tax=Acrocarpospora catenulata TaxID=2836182 RepID=UPI001BDA439C|nr:hypothetical protein [Acrocarpospora catenulata]